MILKRITKEHKALFAGDLSISFVNAQNSMTEHVNLLKEHGLFFSKGISNDNHLKNKASSFVKSAKLFGCTKH